MYTCGWFVLMYGRGQHNIVEQLSSNNCIFFYYFSKKMSLKKLTHWRNIFKKIISSICVERGRGGREGGKKKGREKEGRKEEIKEAQKEGREEGDRKKKSCKRFWGQEQAFSLIFRQENIYWHNQERKEMKDFSGTQANFKCAHATHQDSPKSL